VDFPLGSRFDLQIQLCSFVGFLRHSVLADQTNSVRKMASSETTIVSKLNGNGSNGETPEPHNVGEQPEGEPDQMQYDCGARACPARDPAGKRDPLTCALDRRRVRSLQPP
jgi:hypothetical protein